jgi:hypothetical protein
MPKLFGQELSKRQILERVGDISQIAGVKRYRMEEGKKDSVLAVDMKNGSGLNITVLPGRAMDIAFASYKETPFAFMSKSGLTDAAYYEEPGLGWLRNFYGGLLTTCGLTYAGAPCVDQGEPLGIHGRISNIPADEVCTRGEWVGDDYVVKASGKVTQSRLFGENISMTRQISMKMGENKIYIDDAIENLGFIPQPFMIIYHMNFGFPLVDKDTKLYVTSDSFTGATDFASKSIDSYDIMTAPVPLIEEAVYYHKCYGDENGYGHSMLVNNNLNLGVSLSFNLNELPNLTEWKMMGQGEYVVGMEPCNGSTVGRAREREEGTLKFINPGEIKHIQVVVEIHDGEDAIKNAMLSYK